MQIDFPTAQPNSFGMPVSCFDLETNSVEGRAIIQANQLLFRFYNFSDQVNVEIELSDDHGNGIFAVTNFTAVRNGGTRFVLFRDFPPTAVNTEQSMCRYRLAATNQRNPREGAHVDVQIFAHR